MDESKDEYDERYLARSRTATLQYLAGVPIFIPATTVNAGIVSWPQNPKRSSMAVQTTMFNFATLAAHKLYCSHSDMTVRIPGTRESREAYVSPIDLGSKS